MTAALLLLGMMITTTGQAEAAPQPLAGTTICSYSPIPPGWVVTRSVGSYRCGGYNEYTITELTTQTSATVCSFSPIPPGWVVTRAAGSYSCAGVAYE
ncbi:hypothetical protein, partial [Streptomyces bambusae]